MTEGSMRLPVRPPALEELLNRALKESPDKVSQILTGDRDLAASSNYDHWDKLRYRKPPEGLTHDQWWLAVRMARLTEQKQIPMVDKHGQPFFYGTPDPIPHGLHRIDMTSGGRFEMPQTAEQITNPATRDRYYISSLVQEAITSSQLEGAVTTREIANQMLRSNRPPRDEHEQAILNNYQTMRWLGSVKTADLSPNLLHQMHERITRGTLPNREDEGRLRGPERNVDMADLYGVVCHEPPDARQLPERMEALCRFANGETPASFVHPVVRAIVLHFWLAYDHPYVDGNGRTARALFYWSMLKHDYWLFEFISISQAILKDPKQYYRAFLYTETDQNDLTYFILHQLKVIDLAITQLNEYISRKTHEVQSVEHLIRDATLNHRQRALLSHALRHPNQRYTTASHQTSHRVSNQTARSDLTELTRRNLLIGSKIGKTIYFRPADGLADRLNRLGSEG